MDHRCGERRPATLTVLLRRRAWHGWVVGEVRDVSVSGAFVTVPPGALSLRAQVRLELMVPGGPPGRVVHCNAMVARVTGDGVGLAFEELAPRPLAGLWRMPARAAGTRPDPAAACHT